MSQFLSFLLFVLLIGGLLSVIPELQKSDTYSQSTKIEGESFTVYTEWTIKQIDSLSASTNREFALN